MPGTARYSAFQDHRRLVQGDLRTVLIALAALEQPHSPVLILNDHTGDRLELDPREDLQAALARLEPPMADEPDAPPRAGPGRPRLGVTAKEVTLLPRHWDWLAGQPGGASATLRRLVEKARREDTAAEAARRSHRALDRFLYLVAGDLPGFEEAYRAFYAGSEERFAAFTEAWPADVRDHARELFAALTGPSSES